MADNDPITPLPPSPTACQFCRLEGHLNEPCHLLLHLQSSPPSTLRRLTQFHELVGVFPRRDPGPLIDLAFELGPAWFDGFIAEMVATQPVIKRAVEGGGNSLMEIREAAMWRFCEEEGAAEGLRREYATVLLSRSLKIVGDVGWELGKRVVGPAVVLGMWWIYYRK